MERSIGEKKPNFRDIGAISLSSILDFSKTIGLSLEVKKLFFHFII